MLPPSVVIPDGALLAVTQTAWVDRLRCARCGDIIGVYEPTWVLGGDAGSLQGSWLTLRDELQPPGSTALHERCYQQDQPDSGASGSRREGDVGT